MDRPCRCTEECVIVFPGNISLTWAAVSGCGIALLGPTVSILALAEPFQEESCPWTGMHHTPCLFRADWA
jgi:hypothetical protein